MLQHFKTENKHSAILITRFPVIFIDLKTDVRSQKVVRLWPHLSHRLLRPWTHSDNLSKTLQHKSMSAAEGQHIAQLTLSVLKSLRDQEKFQLFFREFCLISSVLVFQLQLYHVSVVHLSDFRLGQQKGTFTLLLMSTTECSILKQ